MLLLQNFVSCTTTLTQGALAGPPGKPEVTSSPKKKQVLVVDDHPILRTSLANLITAEEDLEICGAVGTVADALQFLQSTPLDLVITDLSLPDRSGFELIEEMIVLHPGIPVLVLSMHHELDYWKEVTQAGACGYLMKEAAATMLVSAVRQVLAGQMFMSAALAKRFRDEDGDLGTDA